MKTSSAKLHPLPPRLAYLRKRAKVIGVFANDCKLLEYPRCGLMEDVASDSLLPPLAEQTRIVVEVEGRLGVVEELESVVSANLQWVVRLRQFIPQRAFTGELL